MEERKNILREFGITTSALKNRSTVFLMAFLLAVVGFNAYVSMPKEAFPEIQFPFVAVQTIYPGNSPVDIENLITRPLEKEIFTIKGIKDMKSSSLQGISDIMIEFNPDVKIKTALQDVKDAVDKAKGELPSDLDLDPIVLEIDVSEFPILNINLSGDYSVNQLRKYAEDLEDQIEGVAEISKVELKGVSEREIKVNVNQHKLDLYKVTFGDIENAIAYENKSISSGEVKIGKTRRSIRTVGEFDSIDQIKNIIVKAENGNIIYLRDVAEVVDGWEETKSYARQDSKSVVSLQVIKKGGENLLHASEQIFAILENSRKDGTLPEDLRITVTNDQSKDIKAQVNNLENSIILGVLFVAMVLYFFLGYRNALFVGMAIPMSMLISFVILSMSGITINMMVLFALVLALGMLVDNAIVVVENIYRFVSQGHSVFEASKYAVGEIAWPIIASTATTLAAFVPLAFWPGLMGEFMKYLPITLIIVLSSSLFVALVIIPVLAATFIKMGQDDTPQRKTTLIAVGVLGSISLLGFLAGNLTLGNLMLIVAMIILLNWAVFFQISVWFQNVFLTWMEEMYLKTLRFALKGFMPVYFFIGTIVLLIFTQVFMGIRQPKVELFPTNEPRFINIKAELPIGTDIAASDSIMRLIEGEVKTLLTSNNYMPIIESIMTTVGQGAVGENESARGDTPHKGITTVTFIDFEDRFDVYEDGRLIDTRDIKTELSDLLTHKYPGVIVSVEKNQNGPPTGPPVNLELQGANFDRLLMLADTIQSYLSEANIEGIEGLRIDLDLGQPELLIHIDRDKARRLGMSTAQIASTIRTALYGKEVSKYKEGEDDFPIYLRFQERFRNSIPSLLNQKITFQNKQGKIMQIPVSAVADFEYSTTFGAVKRIDEKRVITLYSGIFEGANAAKINTEITSLMNNFQMPLGYEWKLTGEQEEQEKSMAFLMNAMGIAVFVILIILVTQFNSIPKPFIIVGTILFSTIGVFGGIATFKMDFIIIMTGIGIISLAGIVVNNAIVLIDYIDYLKTIEKEKLGLGEDENLTRGRIFQLIVQGGKTRLRPVLLTAITTILGLIPMAIGLNINFKAALSEYDPQIYFGGENADFWGPMAWTVIFGLTFSTFLTLVIVPVIYLLGNNIKLWFGNKGWKKQSTEEVQFVKS